ncbi:transposase [Bacillus sp. HMF5848]|uniref:transposase n=1 Tax=Bacillus sp. HMF5848 TaxID=2495421 RepID=UPI0037BFE2F0
MSFYHITSRSIERYLFKTEEDYYRFLNILYLSTKKHNVIICSYCLMRNHFHLIIQTPHYHISNLIGQIKKQYSNYYNKQYNRKGPLYEKRFFAKEVIDNSSLLLTSSYVHFNPTRHNVVYNPHHYQYSSYKYYYDIQQKSPRLLTMSPILNIFSGSIEDQAKSYITWCEQAWLQRNNRVKQ